MSKGQIRKKHGAAAVPPSETSGGRRRPRGSASAGRVPAGSAGAGSGAVGPVGVAPGARGGSAAGIITGVIVAVGVLMFLYLYALILPNLGHTAGIEVPELAFGFRDAEHYRSIAETLGEDGREQYRYIHRSAGLLTPLILALGWMTMIAQTVRGRAARWGLWAVPLALAVVFLAGNAVLDGAVAAPSAEAAQAASWTVMLRWILLAALAGEALYLLARTARQKVDAFARGELPDQVPPGR